MPSVRLSCGPKGITTMKSTMLKNWTEARINSKISSRRRCSAGTVSFLPPSPLRLASAPGGLSALKACSVAIITSAFRVGFCSREFYAEDNPHESVRRGSPDPAVCRESLPFPVLPGYRPMHCLEGLLSGGRTANRARVYIHTLASPAPRAFRVPGRLEPGCGFDPNFSGDRRPRRTDQALRLCCTSPPKEGAVNNADYRGGVTCLYDTQLLGACLHASESGGRSRPEAVRGMPDVPVAPPATGPNTVRHEICAMYWHDICAMS